MKHKNVLESLATAFSGFVFAARHQKNIKYLLAIAIAVVATTPFLDLKTWEAIALVFVISLVIITELVNAGIEYSIDLVTKDYHHLAKAAKDMAAAAVLVACVNAVVIAAIFAVSRLR